MLYLAAVLGGLAIGSLIPSPDVPRGIRIVRAIAVLVLGVLAVLAWPIVSPDSTWPTLLFGLTAVAAAIAMRALSRRVTLLPDEAQAGATSTSGVTG